MPHISIKAEPIIEILGFKVTNSYIASIIVIILFFCLALYYSASIKKKEKSTFFYLLQFVFKSLYNFFETIVKEKVDIFFTLLGALFLYIMLQNWFGLLPGVGSVLISVKEHGESVMAPLLRGNNADLNTTLSLAFIAFLAIQYYGFKYLGFKGYLGKFINVKNPINFIVGFLEIISEFSKIISFSFRLFGNIFAGEILLVIISFLIPFLASFPFLVLEIFVGFVQALVFSMLTAIFVSMAIEKQHS